jgi:hypothetical protein
MSFPNQSYRDTTLQKVILGAIETEAARIVAEEAATAAKRVEERVRAMTSQIVTNVSSWTEFETMRDRLVITVRFPEKGERA